MRLCKTLIFVANTFIISNADNSMYIKDITSATSTYKV
jgi:hypothetical protein